MLVLAACGRIDFDLRSVDGAPLDDDGEVVPGPLAAFSFSEGTVDQTGNGNDLTAAFGTPMLTASGHTGGGLTFTTTSDAFHTTMPSAALDAAATFTLMAWVYPTAVPPSGESMVVSFLGRGPLTYPYGLEAFDQFAGTGRRLATSSPPSAWRPRPWERRCCRSPRGHIWRDVRRHGDSPLRRRCAGHHAPHDDRRSSGTSTMFASTVVHCRRRRSSPR